MVKSVIRKYGKIVKSRHILTSKTFEVKIDDKTYRVEKMFDSREDLLAYKVHYVDKNTVLIPLNPYTNGKLYDFLTKIS